jgi:hypothetical protein
MRSMNLALDDRTSWRQVEAKTSPRTTVGPNNRCGRLIAVIADSATDRAYLGQNGHGLVSIAAMSALVGEWIR